MKYKLDKWKWQNLVLRVKNLTKRGDIHAITCMQAAGINLPFVMRSGQMVEPMFGAQPDKIESVEFDIEEQIEFKGRGAKTLQIQRDTILRYIDSIDRTGDISGEDLHALTRVKDGVVKYTPPDPILEPEPDAYDNDDDLEADEDDTDEMDLEDVTQELVQMATRQSRLADEVKLISAQQVDHLGLLNQQHADLTNQQFKMDRAVTDMKELTQQVTNLRLSVKQLIELMDKHGVGVAKTLKDSIDLAVERDMKKHEAK